MNIYFTGIKHGKIGRASAMSIILFVIMLVLTVVQFKISDSDDVDY
jgi:multiple sugar transport system permease protein